MFSFFSKREKEKYSLIVDIQSGLVRGALVLNRETLPPIIQRVVTKTIPRKIHTNSNYINKMMLKALSNVLLMTSENHLISRVDIVLSSPWVLSHSKAVRIKFDKNTTVTEEVISNLVDIERKKLETEFSTTHKQIPNIYNDLNYIEQKVFDIKLNGYSVSEYIGRVAKDLEISIAMTLSSKVILNRINSVIDKFINSKNIKYHSALLMNFSALRKMMSDKNDYVYIHAHSELTDVIVVKKGLCANISSFPLGTANLIRKISHIFKQSDEVADSMMSLYQGGKLNEVEAKQVLKIIEEFSHGWIALYRRILESTTETGGIPRLIFLSTHSHSEIFKDLIVKNTKEDIHIVDFNLENIESDITFAKTSENNQLIKMYALALEDVL
jgi:cell division ATPase FtsA